MATAHFFIMIALETSLRIMSRSNQPLLLSSLVIAWLVASSNAFHALQVQAHGQRIIRLPVEHACVESSTAKRRSDHKRFLFTTRLGSLKGSKESVEVLETVKKESDKKTATPSEEKPSTPKPDNDDDDRPGLPLELAWSRAMDTVEDAVIHARRMPYDIGWYTPDEDEVTNRETIVVLGSGWAAHALLKCADNFKLRIIVVSPTNHFVFTPMLVRSHSLARMMLF